MSRRAKLPKIGKEISPEFAEGLTADMHSHSAPSAEGAAASHSLDGVSHLLDVRGGSGCFSTSFAKTNKGLHAAFRLLWIWHPSAKLDVTTTDVRESWSTGGEGKQIVMRGFNSTLTIP
jgi:hypothetical protein